MNIKILLATSIIFLSTNAFAGTIFTPGTSKNPAAEGYSVTDNGYIGVQFEAARSYCCDFYARNTDLINTIDTNMYNSLGNTVIGTLVNRTTTTPSNVSGAHTFNRICTTTNTTEIYGIKFTNVTSAGNGNTILVNTHCVETSLYGGYNTNAARYNFLEVLNTTNSTINFKVTATNFDGTVVINNASYSVPAGRRFDVDIHTPAGLSKYGLIKITHDGPFGALQAGVSFYKTDFTQTAHVPLKARDQVQ